MFPIEIDSCSRSRAKWWARRIRKDWRQLCRSRVVRCVVHEERPRSAVKFTEWNIESSGAPNVNGRRPALVLATSSSRNSDFLSLFHIHYWSMFVLLMQQVPLVLDRIPWKPVRLFQRMERLADLERSFQTTKRQWIISTVGLTLNTVRDVDGDEVINPPATFVERRVYKPTCWSLDWRAMFSENHCEFSPRCFRKRAGSLRLLSIYYLTVLAVVTIFSNPHPLPPI